MIRLSDRAAVILYHICERSHDGRSWLPGFESPRNDWATCDGNGVYLNIEGSGDARIIQSLMSKGLLDRRRQDSGGEYCWLYGTDGGRLWCEQNAVRISSIFHGLRKDRDLRDRLLCHPVEELSQ